MTAPSSCIELGTISKKEHDFKNLHNNNNNNNNDNDTDIDNDDNSNIY